MTDEQLTARYTSLLRHLDERQRRLVVAADARAAGRGGISAVARASGLSRPTIHQGLRELDEAPLPGGQVRRAGGGRKKLRDRHPGLVRALESLVEPSVRGDPESPLRWTCKSTRQLARALGSRGYPVSHPTVAALLAELDYSLQANVKTIEEDQHPDRDAQFRYINRQACQFLEQGLPVISVDTKKKEVVGAFAQAGREWRRRGRPRAVKIHDFVDPTLGRAIPYGVYDIGRNDGWVNVGCDHDTARFAVESIRRWWRRMGQASYREASGLLICADSGGSNGYRLRLWKVELNRFVQETGLRVTVCHFPPGASKWNKLEHRLFSHITMNWRGRPLISYDVIVKLLAATSTRSGLRVKAGLDRGRYPQGTRVMESELTDIPLTAHSFHGEWNYTIQPPGSHL